MRIQTYSPKFLTFCNNLNLIFRKNNNLGKLGKELTISNIENKFVQGTHNSQNSLLLIKSNQVKGLALKLHKLSEEERKKINSILSFNQDKSIINIDGSIFNLYNDDINSNISLGLYDQSNVKSEIFLYNPKKNYGQPLLLFPEQSLSTLFHKQLNLDKGSTDPLEVKRVISYLQAYGKR